MNKWIRPLVFVFLCFSACGGEEVQEKVSSPEEAPVAHVASENVETTSPLGEIPAAAPANVSGVETKPSPEITTPSVSPVVEISGSKSSPPSSELPAPVSPAPVAPAEISGHVTPVFEAPQSLKKCLACHTFEKGGGKKVGPNLHGVYGAPAGKSPGFKYTDAFLEVFQGKTWDDEMLNSWLEDSKKMAPKSKMGIKVSDAEDRAAIIQYLRSLR